MDKNLADIEFTIFDTETTGLDPEAGDRIIEIAGIRFKGLERISSFDALINPGRPVSAAAFQVNKISQEMLKDARGIELVIPEFLKFARDSCLCAYNVGFDLGFLNNELKLIGQAPLESVAVIDILKMAKRLLPRLERYGLWFVAERLGIKAEQKHRAFSDVELAWGVFNRLKGLLEEKGVSDFANFSHLFGLNSSFLEDINSLKIAKIQEALELGVKLKIKYLSASSADVSERQIIPKEIKYERKNYYLKGYCCLRNEERTFRIDGILHLEIV